MYIPTVLSAQSLEELQRVLQKELDSIAKVLMNEEFTVLPTYTKSQLNLVRVMYITLLRE